MPCSASRSAPVCNDHMNVALTRRSAISNAIFNLQACRMGRLKLRGVDQRFRFASSACGSSGTAIHELPVTRPKVADSTACASFYVGGRPQVNNAGWEKCAKHPLADSIINAVLTARAAHPRLILAVVSAPSCQVTENTSSTFCKSDHLQILQILSGFRKVLKKFWSRALRESRLLGDCMQWADINLVFQHRLLNCDEFSQLSDD